MGLRRNYHQQMVVTYTVYCHPLKETSTGTIATKSVVLIGTIAANTGDLPSIIWCASVAAREYFPFGGPYARCRHIHLTRDFSRHFHPCVHRIVAQGVAARVS